MTDLAARLDELVALARAAGRTIMAVYATDFEHRSKADQSPVTEADLAAEALIGKGLSAIAPEVPLVAEEAAAAGRLPDVSGGRFWLVDPLDGTREFLSRNGEFTVNIALVEDRRPVLGVIHAPALDITCTGIVGSAAPRARGAASPRRLRVRPAPADGVTVVASRRHGDPRAIEQLLGGRPVAARKSAGSSLKFCLVAAGEADLYPRYGRTMEWDTAAGQAILTAAGGRVTDRAGRELTYGKPDYANPPFIAWGGVEPWTSDD